MMDDEDSRKKAPPFQMTPQVAVIIMIAMLAMGIPLFGVAWLASDYLRAPRAAEPTSQAVGAENPVLRSALEKAASSLSVEPLEIDREVLEIRGTEATRKEKIRTLNQIVRQNGGSVVELETGTRFLVSATPAGQVAVRRALAGSNEEAEFPSMSFEAPNASPANPAAGGKEVEEFFEVRFLP